jgi:membrane fusion protein, multidrug efflux system
MNRSILPLTLTVFRFATGALTIAALAVGCNQAQGGKFAPPPTPVEVSDVSQVTVADQFEAVGNVEAAEAITVVAEIDALVTSLPFAEGQSIQQGGLIAQLDDQLTRAAVASAEATRDQAKISYDRVKNVVEAGAGAKQELDNATAVLKVAQAQLDLAQVRLSKTRISAPFDGVLGSRRVSPGAFLRAGETITTLTQINRLKITFAAPERIFPLLKRGSSVTVSSPAYPGYSLAGVVDVIDPVVDEATRTVRIIARVDNTDRKLRPGMSANVSAVLTERPNSLIIPDEAVFAEGNQAFVFVVKPDSTVSRTAITLGSRQSGSVEVTGGLAAGMRVIRAGHQKLYEGAKVMPVVSGGPAASSGQPGGKS